MGGFAGAKKITLSFRDFTFEIDGRARQAFVKCEAEELLRESKMIQADLNELVARQAPQTDGMFYRAIEIATINLATKLTRSWAIEDATKVRMDDPLFVEYRAFTDRVDCLVGEQISVEDIVAEAILILCHELRIVESR